MALHGGTISVYSPGEGCGSTFAVELPLYEGAVRSSCSSICSTTNMSHRNKSVNECNPSPKLSTELVLNHMNRSSKRPSESSVFCDTPGVRERSEDFKENLISPPPEMTPMKQSMPILDFYENEDNVISSRRSMGLLALEEDCPVRIYSRARVTPLANPLIGTKTTTEKRNSKSRSAAMRVLVVDDAATNRKMTCRSLKNTFGEIDEASDGVDAVSKVRSSIESKRPYDLILMDFIMPNMDGPTATKIIRDELGFTGIIVGLTGNALQSDINTFLVNGAEKVLVKPLTLSVLRIILS